MTSLFHRPGFWFPFAAIAFFLASCANERDEPVSGQQESKTPGEIAGKEGPAGTHGPAITSIAFGSCSKQRKNREQTIWSTILKHEPDLFLFMGDNVYADTTDMEVMRAKYQELADQPGYQKLRASSTILATWDDHDYGGNDSGADYPMREGSQKVFLEFFEVPKEAPEWSRPGIYSAHTFGPPGKRIQVILLDTRYFRSALVENPESERRKIGYYQPNTGAEATILGNAQWKWLEEQLVKPAEIRVLVSSIQVIPEEQLYEKWSNFPNERARLFRVLKNTKANGVILLSGDRHLAEISEIPMDDPAGVGYALTEFTSSGLSEGSGSQDEPNRYRASPSNFRKPNFGLIQIAWDAPSGATATVSIRDTEGTEVFANNFLLASLKQ